MIVEMENSWIKKASVKSIKLSMRPLFQIGLKLTSMRNNFNSCFSYF